MPRMLRINHVTLVVDDLAGLNPQELLCGAAAAP
mgnify:CR=1 FL=1